MVTTCLLSDLPLVRPEPAHRRRGPRPSDLASDLAGLSLVFEPRVALRSGRAVAAEALLRSTHRKRGPVCGSVAFPLSQSNGQVTGAGAWALRDACRAAAAWPGISLVSVNLALRRLGDRSLLHHIAVALHQSELRTERLEIAIAEVALVDADDDALFVLAALRDLGVGVVLDDFGETVASLSALRRFPLTSVKLSRVLVRDLPHDTEAAALAQSVVTVGHALGLTVVADGIETAAQRNTLALAGCDFGQGSLFGHALPDAEIAFRLAG